MVDHLLGDRCPSHISCGHYLLDNVLLYVHKSLGTSFFQAHHTSLKPPTWGSLRSCTFSSEVSIGNSCRGGRCQRPALSLTRSSHPAWSPRKGSEMALHACPGDSLPHQAQEPSPHSTCLGNTGPSSSPTGPSSVSVGQRGCPEHRTFSAKCGTILGHSTLILPPKVENSVSTWDLNQQMVRSSAFLPHVSTSGQPLLQPSSSFP